MEPWTKTIDELLERYLGLLDEYTTLQARLSRAQSSMYFHIARANFSAERGLRYGQDQYDGRMQALRRLSVSCSEAGGEGAVSYAVAAAEVGGRADAVKVSGDERDPEKADADTDDDDDESAGPPDPEPEEQRPRQTGRDPLSWFGILTPAPLRQARDQAVDTVEHIIPRLASVSAQMKAVEVEVRRARKKRAKAAEGKKADVQRHAGVSTSSEATV